MLLIKKMRNVYGIKNLVNPELLNGNTIIYAPNGVMKSSLADGLESISKNQKPNDVYYGQICEFELDLDGTIISDSSPNTEFPLLVFSEKTNYNDILVDPNIFRIVLDDKLKAKFSDCMKSAKDILDNVTNAVSSSVIYEKKITSRSISILRNVYGGTNDVQTLLNIEKIDNPLIAELSGVSYLDIINKDTEDMIKDPGFTIKIMDYLSIINRQMNEVIFNNGFGINELQIVNEALNKNFFYSAGHKVLIGSKEYVFEDIQSLIDTSIIEIYSSSESKSKFDEIKKALTKNKATKTLSAILEKEPRLLTQLNNLEEFKKGFIWERIKNSLVDFDNDCAILEGIKEQIADIQKEAKSSSSIWQKALETYNARFMNKSFTIEIANKTNAILGIDLPLFVQSIHGTNINTNPEIQKRMSTGERRALTILNFIFKIELLENIGKPYLLVLDDIVDSFDYKNKFALIEYLSDLASNKNIQLLILTHNFDFYRSCRISLNDSLVSKVLAYNYDGDVTLFDNKSKHFIGFGYFFDWKNRGTDIAIYSLIPFIRNMVHLELGSSSPEYLLITSFLHYNRNLEVSNIGLLDPLFTKYGIKLSPTYKSKVFLDMLIEIAKPLLVKKKIDETKLESKIILGYLIRILSDKFMIDKYFNIHKNDPVFSDDLGYSKKLFDEVKENFTDPEKTVILSSFTVAPSFIHVNSFMYEPLVDVGSDKMLELANKLVIMNNITI